MTTTSAAAIPTGPARALHPGTRFQALDVFRGMTICFMIIVNTPGNGDYAYSPLDHAAWNGFTPTDLVFPSFLFAVGNAMSFAMARWNTLPASKVWMKIIKRAFIIFLLGYLMYWFPFFQADQEGHWALKPLSHTRILGVLQRIGLAYGIASFLIYYCKPRACVAISILLLLVYWGLLRLGNPADPFGMTTNIGTRLDKWLLGENHMYHGEGIAFEPEGWLSTLPSIVNVIAGWLAGRFVQQKGKTYEGLTRLLLTGFALLTVAYFWDLVFPINKKLWTSSFVLYTVGLDCIILPAILYIIDFRQKTRWARFFEIFGKNPLFIYLLSELGATLLYLFQAGGDNTLYSWIYDHIFKGAGLSFGSLLFSLSFMMICWLAGLFLDKKKIYVRV